MVQKKGVAQHTALSHSLHYNFLAQCGHALHYSFTSRASLFIFANLFHFKRQNNIGKIDIRLEWMRFHLNRTDVILLTTNHQIGELLVLFLTSKLTRCFWIFIFLHRFTIFNIHDWIVLDFPPSISPKHEKKYDNYRNYINSKAMKLV